MNMIICSGEYANNRAVELLRLTSEGLRPA